jgi:hypothetical protein
VADPEPLPRETLTGVRYVNLADAAWAIPERPVHRLDFGLELQFGGSVYSAVWTDGAPYGLAVEPNDLSKTVINPVRTDVSDVAPWSAVIGTPVRQSRHFQPSAWKLPREICSSDWVLTVDFEEHPTICIVAANYLDEFPDDIGLCGDEVLVVFDASLASAWKLTG